ncbi:phosphonate metabolism transcriptional regulator PhnF [bacterium]|nr:phosphonate metabolism transcriptional regulator PhnF [bacterium]
MGAEKPLWRGIADRLEERIARRELSPGDKLPTEADLAREHMVNRHTVRRALVELQAKGVVETSQGRGSFVRRQTLVMRIRRRTRFKDNMRHAGADYRHVVNHTEVGPADAAIAEGLGLRIGAPVVTVERTAYVGGEAIGIGRHHFSHARLPSFIEMYRTRGSITETLRDCGVPDYVRARTTVISRLPTAAEAAHFNMPRHIPLLITRSVNHDMLGEPVEYGESRFAADRIELRMDFDDDSRSPKGD